MVPAANAKVSEYHAAVGLAALDEWPDVRKEWMALARAYRRALPESNQLRFQRGFGEDWVAATCVLDLVDSEAARIETALAQAGIETRRWWRASAHVHAATKEMPRTALPVTEALVNSTIAVPFFRGIEEVDIRRVAQAVIDAAGAQCVDRCEERGPN